jgi:hypothetical protein
MFVLFFVFTACSGLYWLEIGICVFSCGGMGEFLVVGEVVYILLLYQIPPATDYFITDYFITDYFNKCFEYFLKIIFPSITSIFKFYFVTLIL